MKKTFKKIVFFGNERLATGVTTSAPILQSLIKSGYDVVALVANYEPARSRAQKPLEVINIAKTHNIPVLLPNRAIDIKHDLEKYQAAAGVLVAYGQIIPREIINIFPSGIINLHPSLLPRHRGSTPIESVILANEPKTGVSIMKLSQEMDAGPVFGQAELGLKGLETKQALADQLLEIGGSMLMELLGEIIDGKVVALEQDESRAIYDKPLTKKDGLIDWHKPAEQIEREVRAFSGWPGSYCKLGNIEIIITKARVAKSAAKAGEILINGKKLSIGCSRNALEIERLKPAGKKEMSTEAFLAGYKNKLAS